MPKLNVIKPFKFSPNGVDVIEYGNGTQDVSERCAEIAVAEGWGKRVIERQPRKQQSETEFPVGMRDK